MSIDTKNKENDVMEKIVALCKRRGFVFQGSEIYGGLAGTWDFGPYGATLSCNIKELWWKHFVSEQENIYGISTATIMPEAVWRASGHLSGFHDPMIECTKCHHRFRADHLSETLKKVKNVLTVEVCSVRKKLLTSCFL